MIFQIALAFLLFYVHRYEALETREKLFNVDSSASGPELRACLVSCLDINCGGVSVGENGSCVFYTQEEWHPEIVQASDAVSINFLLTFKENKTIININPTVPN